MFIETHEFISKKAFMGYKYFEKKMVQKCKK
jgi:hypothetical protein